MWPLRGKGENWFVPALPSAVVCPSVISVVVARSGFLVIRSTIRNRREFAVRLALGASTERFKLLFRADLFNLFNHTNFSNPIATYTSSSFGKITSTVGSAAGGTGYAIGGVRLAQFSLRLNF